MGVVASRPKLKKEDGLGSKIPNLLSLGGKSERKGPVPGRGEKSNFFKKKKKLKIEEKSPNQQRYISTSFLSSWGGKQKERGGIHEKGKPGPKKQSDQGYRGGAHGERSATQKRGSSGILQETNRVLREKGKGRKNRGERNMGGRAKHLELIETAGTQYTCGKAGRRTYSRKTKKPREKGNQT